MDLPVFTPTILLDKQKCLANIQKMAAKMKPNKVILRPHFKTHQSNEVGQWFRDFGIKAITVSSLKMAKYFAMDGWEDITVAFPTNILEIDSINELSKKIQLNLVIESIESLNFLKENLLYPVAVYLKIDAGYHRTGIDVNDTIYISELLSQLESCKYLTFVGFLAHAGHSYECRSAEEILKIHQETEKCLKELKSKFVTDYPSLQLSVGDTPTCSVAENFDFADEIRPGNFVFYDVMQTIIGSCQLEDIAVAVACPVVALHPSRNEIIVYGGGVHLSKDSAKLPETNQSFYGYLAELNADKKSGWKILPKENYVKSLSQEHGIIKVTNEVMNKIKIGDVLIVLPIHSCMTADLIREYLTLDGEVIAAGKY